MITRSVTAAEHMAARHFAEANASDPFAYGRMICHLRQGIEDATEAVNVWRPRALKLKIVPFTPTEQAS